MKYKSRLAYWQKILGLRDWELTVTVCDEATINAKAKSDNLLGYIETQRLDKSGTVLILDKRPAEEMERTLVHELTHALLDDMMRDITLALDEMASADKSEVYRERIEFQQERVVRSLTKAFMALENKKK